MKKLLLLIGLICCFGSASAQTKTAYCDVYMRGGGKNLWITIMYDGHDKDLFNRYNMGEILNILAEDGWEVNRDFIVPRHPLWSLFTRHKLHIIMKKEYHENENPYAYIDALYLCDYGVIKDRYDINDIITATKLISSKDRENTIKRYEDKYIEYNGVPAIVVNGYDNKIMLIAKYAKKGNWYEAVEYSESLGGEWKLPTSQELKSINLDTTFNNEDEYIWTSEEEGKHRALLHNMSLYTYFIAYKKSEYNILPIAIVDAESVEFE